MTFPLRAVFITPADYPSLGDDDQAAALMAQWIEDARRWFARETGWTFNVTFTTYRSSLTALELHLGEMGGATSGPVYRWTNKAALEWEFVGDEPCLFPGIQGFDENLMWAEWGKAAAREGWGAVAGPDPFFSEVAGRRDYRRVAIVRNGGGWAGGKSFKTDTEDGGECALGDWGIRPRLHGLSDPSATSYPIPSPLYALQTGYTDLGHEMCHGLNVWSHDPNIGTNDPMLPDRIEDFRNRNVNWLVPSVEAYPQGVPGPAGDYLAAPAPEPPPAPPPPPEPIPTPKPRPGKGKGRKWWEAWR